jgi:long-chain acyl-CoA synthetase
MTAGATSGDRFRSWPEILANAARAAGGLRALGVAEDDSVALMLRNDFATFEVNMAAGQLGAYAVPINWHFTPEEAGYILADSRAKVFVIHADQAWAAPDWPRLAATKSSQVSAPDAERRSAGTP